MVGTGRRDPLCDALAGGPPCRMAASADGRSWATPQARPECTPEPDDEVLARIVGAADGQAIPPQALAGSANIVDLKRAGGRRHSAGPGGPPRAESERLHSSTLIAHDRSLDEIGVDRLGTESEAVAEDDPMECRAPAASYDLVLNTVSALAEFE